MLRQSEMLRRELAAGDVGDDPQAVTDPDDVPNLGNIADGDASRRLRPRAHARSGRCACFVRWPGSNLSPVSCRWLSSAL